MAEGARLESARRRLVSAVLKDKTEAQAICARRQAGADGLTAELLRVLDAAVMDEVPEPDYVSFQTTGIGIQLATATWTVPGDSGKTIELSVIGNLSDDRRRVSIVRKKGTDLQEQHMPYPVGSESVFPYAAQVVRQFWRQ
jgi:hypothetical protein